MLNTQTVYERESEQKAKQLENQNPPARTKESNNILKSPTPFLLLIS